MNEYVCVTRCQFRGRVWTSGETLMSNPKEVIPRHFKIKKDISKKEAKLIDDTPETMYEIQRQETKEAEKINTQQETAAKQKEKELDKQRNKEEIKKRKEETNKIKEDDNRVREAVTGIKSEKENDFMK